MELSDRFETVDGSRPVPTWVADAVARAIPLPAFAILTGGDAVEAAGARHRDPTAARRWAGRQLGFAGDTPAGEVERVRHDAVTLLCGNSALVARLESAKPISVTIVATDRVILPPGFPRAAAPSVAGLFWDEPAWPEARILLRRDRLSDDPTLVVHELAHAVHYLAFTRAERDTIDVVLGRAFGTRSEIDEVFAIYSEREFLDGFGDAEKRAPGIYGFTRRQWSEGHLFTRFVRKLYRPEEPLAGPPMAPLLQGSWMRGIRRR
jgi:hypothetical protein